MHTRPNLAYSHSIAFCPQLTSTDKQLISRYCSAENPSENLEEENSDQEENDEYESSNEEEKDPVQTRLVQSQSQFSTIKINKVSITESPILAASYANETIYLVLDTGATASLMSLRQAQALNLKIYPTSHKAIQVDGNSDLPIAGEVQVLDVDQSASNSTHWW